MKFSRATLLALLWASLPLAAKLSKQQQAEHALNRLSFGPRPGKVERVDCLGVKKRIQQQLNPASIAHFPALEQKLTRLPSLQLSTTELVRRYPSQQMIIAAASGREPLLQDPQLRTLYDRLSRRYQSRIERKTLEKPEEVVPKPDNELDQFLRRRIVSLSAAERAEPLRRLALQQAVAAELTEAKLYRAVYSERQEVVDDCL